MELIDFYEQLLKGLSIEDLSGAGLLSSVFDPEKPQAVTVGGKRLTLPLKDVLREGKKEDQIIFHPLSENVTRGESDVIKALRDYIQWRCLSVTVQLAEELGRVAASPSEHKKLGPKASKFLQQLPDFDAKTNTALGNLIKRVSPDPERRVVSITLRQGSKSKDDGAIRSAQVSFPLLEDLATDGLEVFGMNMPSKKAKARLHKLFEIILGDEETRATFNYGSANSAAPYLHALLTTYSRIAAQLNKVVETHAKLLGESLVEKLHTPLDWVVGLEEFGKLRAMVPPQSGNEGSIKASDKKKEEKPSASKPTRQLLAPPEDRGVKEEAVDLPWEEDETPARTERAPVRSTRREESASSSTSLSDYNRRLRGETDDDRGNSRSSGKSIFRRESSDRPGSRGGYSRGNSERGGRFGGGGYGRSRGRY